jgi:hypothetical protein
MCLRVSYRAKIFFFKYFFCILKVTEDSYPLVKGTDPRIRIRTKMSRIPNTAFQEIVRKKGQLLLSDFAIFSFQKTNRNSLIQFLQFKFFEGQT